MTNMGEAVEAQQPVPAEAAPADGKAPAPGAPAEMTAEDLAAQIKQAGGAENSGLTAAEWQSMENMDTSTANTHTMAVE